MTDSTQLIDLVCKDCGEGYSMAITTRTGVSDGIVYVGIVGADALVVCSCFENPEAISNVTRPWPLAELPPPGRNTR